MDKRETYRASVYSEQLVFSANSPDDAEAKYNAYWMNEPCPEHGGAFFGESMFSRADDASKIALVHLVARLIDRGFVLLDAQFHNPHLEQFGLIEIPRDTFKALLKKALKVPASFHPPADQSMGSGSAAGSTGAAGSTAGGASDSAMPAGVSSTSGSSPSGTITRSGSFTGAGAVQRITQIS